MRVMPRLIGIHNHCPGRRIDGDGDGVAGPNDLRNILFEPIDHGKIGEGRTLRHNRIGVIQQEGERCHAGLLHRPQHPRRDDAALRDIGNQDFAIIALAEVRVALARKGTVDAV